MSRQFSTFLFNAIAPFYGLFYQRQRATYTGVLGRVEKVLDLHSYLSILDVGCGTGALGSVLSEQGFRVTGVEPAAAMLRAASKKAQNKAIRFVHADVLHNLPFDDKHFDLSIASYVAHGLQPEERKKMYAEMSRVTRHKVIIHDYNQNRALGTNIVEWVERGDYFNFIKTAESEMSNCEHELNACFSDVQVIDVETRAAWYICTPA